MNEAAQTLIVAGLALASLSVWIVVLLRRAAGMPILSADPRRDVPWRMVDVLLVLITFLLFAVLAQAIVIAIIGPPSPGENKEPHIDVAARLTPLLIADGLAKLCTIAFAVFWVVVRRQATSADFGLTSSDSRRDVTLGILGYVAALLPVYCVQAMMIEVSPPDEQHPVLQVLAEKSDIAALALAVFFAVVFAPLAEEFLFRAFLQGWLEAALPKTSRPPLPAPSELVTEVEPQFPVEPPPVENPYAPPVVIPTRAADPDPPRPAVGEQTTSGHAENGVTASASQPVDLPLSGLGIYLSRYWVAASVRRPVHVPPRPAWPAIVISSITFAALHADNWPAPIPLFLLALILGYLYNRTHRLLPCILVHLFFNGLSVAAVLSGVGAK